MVKAWYMDDDLTNQQAPHQTVPPLFVSVEKLLEIGVHYWHVKSEDDVTRVVQERGYNYQDEVTCSQECLPDYELMLTKFYEEHLHIDDETRLVVEGSGYFDVRDPRSDKWIRINVVKDDFISIPPGLYHRFTLDENNFARVRRFFVGCPVWTPYNRAEGDHPTRSEYLKLYQTVN